jgi:hypothetical protein
MQIKKKNHNESSADVQLVSYCPLCRHSFSPREAAVLGQGDTSHLLYVHCNFCSSSLVVLLLVNKLGISSVGVITDLTEEDVWQVKDAEPINADDCLEVYRALEDGLMIR